MYNQIHKDTWMFGFPQPLKTTTEEKINTKMLLNLWNESVSIYRKYGQISWNVRWNHVHSYVCSNVYHSHTYVYVVMGSFSFRPNRIGGQMILCVKARLANPLFLVHVCVWYKWGMPALPIAAQLDSTREMWHKETSERVRKWLCLCWRRVCAGFKSLANDGGTWTWPCAAGTNGRVLAHLEKETQPCSQHR